MLENVEEFVTWGPVRKGKPVKKKAGQTFLKWKRQLEDLGYKVEHREIVAADEGAPTTRKRFVLVARCDGRPIVWPERTHAPRDSEEVKSGKLKPRRSAAEIIDWSLPGYSIFASRQEIWDQHGVRAQRPLRPNTLRRIIRGVDKFTIKSGNPFIVPIGYGERKGQAPRVQDMADPVGTVVARDKFSLAQPVMAPFGAECNHSGGGHIKDLRNPLNTITGKHTGGVASAVAVPYTFSNTGGSGGNRPGGDLLHTGCGRRISRRSPRGCSDRVLVYIPSAYRCQRINLHYRLPCVHRNIPAYLRRLRPPLFFTRFCVVGGLPIANECLIP